MTKSGLSALLASFLLLPSTSLAATLHESSTLVRRESKSATSDVSKQALLSKRSCTNCAKHDYVVGNTRSGACKLTNGAYECGTHACKNPNPTNSQLKETLVTDYDACIDAAKRANAHYEPEHKFKITEQQYEKKYPLGCFHIKCVPTDSADGAEKDCYYLNLGDGSVDCSDSDCRGTPICERELFVNGAVNGQSDADSGFVNSCPTADYVVIHNETLCNEMCSIKNDVCNEFFRIGNDNFTEHFDHPPGCFHSNTKTVNGTSQSQASGDEMERIFFNPLLTQTGSSPVTGTVLCDVETPMDWNSPELTGLDSVSSGSLHDGHHNTDGTGAYTAAPSAAA